MMQISPSILAADFSNLEREINDMQKAGAHMIHLDIMDGHFVPNISFGIPVVKSLRKKTEIPFDVHLMISNPLKYVSDFINAGADIIVFHLESESNIQDVIDIIKKHGKKCGISIKPNTSAETIFPYLAQLDMVLVMTVEPGFGGQKFMESMCSKIHTIREKCDNLGINMDIEVDGGIDATTIKKAADAGANVFVAGSALFGKPDYSVAVQNLLQQIG